MRPGDASGAGGIAAGVGATAAGTALSTLVSDDAGWSRTSVPTGSASVKASVAAASAYRARAARAGTTADRKSTRLNSSHSQISYAVFCLKKKKQNTRDNLIFLQSLSCCAPHRHQLQAPTAQPPCRIDLPELDASP